MREQVSSIYFQPHRDVGFRACPDCEQLFHLVGIQRTRSWSHHIGKRLSLPVPPSQVDVTAFTGILESIWPLNLTCDAYSRMHTQTRTSFISQACTIRQSFITQP